MTTHERFVIKPITNQINPDHYLQLLSQLTTSPSSPNFLQQLNLISSNPLHQIYLVYDSLHSSDQTPIATGTLLIEPKFIHNCSFVAHIEDIVVDQSYCGQGLGKFLVNHLIKIAKQNNCYKVILDCSPNNEGFYQKSGFENKGTHMALYLETKAKI